MTPCRRLIHLCVFLGLLMYIASQGELEEAMSKILMEEVESAKGKYDTYPVQFVLYSNNNGSRKRIVSSLKETGKIHQGLFNASATIKILVHGWRHRLKTDFESNFMRAYNGTMRYVQVVAVRWKEADRDYIGARRAVPGVAHQVYQYVQRLNKDYGIPPHKLGFFGHGLGAQISGAVGHLARGGLGKIIAMDPAMPLFWQNTHDSVNKSSARRVIGIHTSAATFGVIWNVGHSDFWAMDGMAPQRPCLKLKTPEEQLRCSHEQAYKYFVETVKDRGSIVAETCGRKYVCKPEVFKKQKVMLTEFTRARGQFCFLPPRFHPWPKLKDILDQRNKTDLPTAPPINETTTPLTSGGSNPTLAPGETTSTLAPGETASTLAPGETAGPPHPGASTSPLPPGASTPRLPPGASTPRLPPGASTPGDSSSDTDATQAPPFPLNDCDEMIRLQHALLHGSRGLHPGTGPMTRALRAKLKKCEDLKTRMKRISNHSSRRRNS